jgi:hypothetical protein
VLPPRLVGDFCVLGGRWVVVAGSSKAWLPEARLRLPDARLPAGRGLEARSASAEELLLLLAGASPTGITRWRGAAALEPRVRELDAGCAAPPCWLGGRAELWGFRLLGGRSVAPSSWFDECRLEAGLELGTVSAGAASALRASERLEMAVGAGAAPAPASGRGWPAGRRASEDALSHTAEQASLGFTGLASVGGAGREALGGTALSGMALAGGGSSAAEDTSADNSVGAGAMRSMVASSLPSRRSSAIARCWSRIRRWTRTARSGWSTYSR